jgi:hypothetical protein
MEPRRDNGGWRDWSMLRSKVGGKKEPRVD